MTKTAGIKPKQQQHRSPAVRFRLASTQVNQARCTIRESSHIAAFISSESCERKTTKAAFVHYLHDKNNKFCCKMEMVPVMLFIFQIRHYDCTVALGCNFWRRINSNCTIFLLSPTMGSEMRGRYHFTWFANYSHSLWYRRRTERADEKVQL